MECQTRIQNEKQNIDKKYEKYSKILDECTNYINNETIDKNEISQIKNEFIQKKQLLLSEIKYFNYFIFNEKKMKFLKFEIDDSINEYNIGTFIYEPLPFDFNDYCQKLNLNQLSFNTFKQIAVLGDGNIVITYLDTADHCCISIFNKDFNLIKSTKVSSVFANVIECYIYSINNEILVNYSVYVDAKTVTYHLSIINQNFEVKITYPHLLGCLYNSMFTDSKRVIGMVSEVVNIFDHNLNLVKSYLNVNYKFSNIIGAEICSIQTLNDKFILRIGDEIRILNEISEVKEATIKKKGINQMIINNNRILLVIYNENDKQYEMEEYETNGQLITKYPLNGLINDCFISYSDNNKIHFTLNKKTLELLKYQ
jgi:hypothetical protein